LANTQAERDRFRSERDTIRSERDDIKIERDRFKQQLASGKRATVAVRVNLTMFQFVALYLMAAHSSLTRASAPGNELIS
jgi:hypothetical protein